MNMLISSGISLNWNLYLKCDILVLADVFEHFRNNRLKNYGLCWSHYLSAPTLIWIAMLIMIKVELELIPDADMYVFFEKAMRGGVSYVSKRYSKSNNNYLKFYDQIRESKHIIYFDANNLHVTCSIFAFSTVFSRASDILIQKLLAKTIF